MGWWTATARSRARGCGAGFGAAVLVALAGCGGGSGDGGAGNEAAMQDSAAALHDPLDAEVDAASTVAQATEKAMAAGPLPSAQPLRAQDVLSRAQVAQPFAQQTWRIQCEGRNVNVSTVPETGITGAVLEDGTRLKFGKVADPDDPARRALVFRTNLRNRYVSGAPRCEGVFARTADQVQPNTVVWQAMRVWVDDWSTTPVQDGQLLSQWHDSIGGMLPPVGFYIRSNELRLWVRWDAGARPSRQTTRSKLILRKANGVVGRWLDIVVQAKMSTRTVDQPFFKVWLDGNLAADYRGPLGYTGDVPYVKFGMYKWVGDDNPWTASVPTRTAYFRDILLVRDPDQRYTAADLRAALAP